MPTPQYEFLWPGTFVSISIQLGYHDAFGTSTCRLESANPYLPPSGGQYAMAEPFNGWPGISSAHQAIEKIEVTSPGWSPDPGDLHRPRNPYLMGNKPPIFDGLY